MEAVPDCRSRCLLFYAREIISGLTQCNRSDAMKLYTKAHGAKVGTCRPFLLDKYLKRLLDH